MLALIILAVIASFASVVFIGPPYLPTLTPQVKTALDLLDVKPGQTVLELGCGDGKVLLAAAKRGCHATGIEINPVLVLLCRLRTWRYRKLVTVRMGNYWNTRLWGEADAIFGFVLPRYMSKLDGLIEVWRAGKAIKLASFAFKIPNKPIDHERDSVFLYIYK